LRSTSSTPGPAGSPVLQPNSAKRNSPWSSRPRGGAATAKKPKLGRAHSSAARLPTGPVPPPPPAPAARGGVVMEKVLEYAPADDRAGKKLKVATLLSASGNDSDKENWSPDEERRSQTHRGARRPLPSAPSAIAAGPKLPASNGASNTNNHGRRALGRALDDLPGPAFLAPGGRAHTTPAPRRAAKGAGVFAELDIFEDAADVDDEVARFMGSGNVSPSKEAVVGLLSLAQGNRR